MKTLTIIIAVCALWFGAAAPAQAGANTKQIAAARAAWQAQHPDVALSVATTASAPPSTLDVGRWTLDVSPSPLIAFLYAIKATRWEEELCAIALAIAACAFLPKQYRSLGAFIRYLRWVARQTKQEFARLKLLLRSLLALASWRPYGYSTANVSTSTAQGSHDGPKTYRVDAALAKTHLLVKAGTDERHVDICGASDYPVGLAIGEAEAIEDTVGVDPLVGGKTMLARCATALAAGIDLYAAANGFVQAEPAVAGTFYKVGRSKRLAVLEGTSNYQIEFEARNPVKVVVIAALTATTNIGTLNSTAVNPTKTDFDALLVAAEKVRVDLLAIGAALATPAEIKVLT